MVFTDPGDAERLLRQALLADPFHGPAHNNLGVLDLSAGRFGDAADRFETARRLMPGHPDPRLNLAIVLERAGRLEQAVEAYNAALEVAPDHLPTLMALSRMQVRTGRTDARTAGNLRQIIMLTGDPEWRRWAERALIDADE
jgi:Flp pilus assembly protein TadD